jgi:hypothetical protein
MLKTKKKNNRKKNLKYKDQIRKKNIIDFDRRMKLKTNKTLAKEPRKKLKIKRRMIKLKKNIIYNKLELRTKLKIKISSRKGQREKSEI